jgi:hypothetical protein
MVGARLANLKRGDNRFTVDTSIDVSTTQSDAAEQMSVSVPSIQRAAAVQRTGAPELQQAVDAGQVSVSAAADVATLPEEEQRSMVGARLANLKRGDNQFTKEHPSIGGTSQSAAAEQMQVGVKSIERAAAVQRTGTPELVAAVDSGDVSVSAAAEVQGGSEEKTGATDRLGH